MSKRSLDERKGRVLRALVWTYIETGEPVGSERLHKSHRFGVSAATIRNILSELEEEGYLTHPHTSAGRVPTDRGYRFYVNTLSEHKKLPQREIEQIQHTLSGEDSTDKLMMRTSQLLSSITRTLAIVVSPPNSQIQLKHIQFTKLASHKTLMVLISHLGIVQHKVVNLPESFSQDELNQASRYLVEEFQGKSLDAIRQELLSLVSQERAHYDLLLKKAIILCRAGLSGSEEEKAGDVYLDGASLLMAQPEFADSKRIHELLKTIEEKSRLVKLITACINPKASGLTVLIGRETTLEGMENCALIIAPLGYGDVVVGSVGVLGSTRMEYDKAIPIVDCVTKIFADIIQDINV